MATKKVKISNVDRVKDRGDLLVKLLEVDVGKRDYFVMREGDYVACYFTNDGYELCARMRVDSDSELYNVWVDVTEYVKQKEVKDVEGE